MLPSIYIIQARETGLIKIGRSVNPETRIRNIATISGLTINILNIINCQCAISAEKLLHTEFAKKRIVGEWFNLNTSDISSVKKITYIKYKNIRIYENTSGPRFKKIIEPYQRANRAGRLHGLKIRDYATNKRIDVYGLTREECVRKAEEVSRGTDEHASRDWEACIAVAKEKDALKLKGDNGE